MRKLLVVVVFAILPLGTAQAQFCPGAAPYVFTDVLANDTFCGFITRMAVEGITTGCQFIDANNRRYCPDDFVTRKQMAAFIIRGADAQFPLTCAAGQVMKWNGLDWACADDNIGGSGGGGTVTSVAAGTGLAATPNPIVGAGVMNLAPGYQLPQGCGNGQVAKSNGSNVWTCQNDNDTNSGGTVTSVTAGTGLAASPANPISGTGTLNLAAGYQLPQGCTNGQVPKSNGAGGWTCQSDNAGPANAYTQGGNAFAATAVLGTTDNNALDVRVNGARVMRYEPNAISPNVIGGSPANNVTAGVRGATIAGGGVPTGDTDPNFSSEAPNHVTDVYGTVGGGYANRAGDDAGTTFDRAFATVGGGRANTASGQQSTVGGGANNNASGQQSKVGGGIGNTASGSVSTVGGGSGNEATGMYSTVSGGNGSTASGQESVVGGGALNNAIGAWSTVGGGSRNEASGDLSTVGGGGLNIASGLRGTVGGGESNTASAYASTVAGGQFNTASGNFSWAGGRRAKTQTADAIPEPHHGAFVWADGSDFDFRSAANNEFAARATGGVRFVTQVDGGGNATRQVTFNPNAEIEFGNPQVRQMLNLWGTLYGIGIQAAGMYFRVDAGIGATGGFNWYRGGVHDATADAPGTGGFQLMRLDRSGNLFTAGAINPPSDAGLKTDFRAIDTQEVLERVVAMPIATWRYREDPAQQRHVGPTAQDFRAAFGLGGGDKTIATVDADGVALAAIQGLNAKVEARLAEKDAAIAARDAEIAQLKSGLTELRRAVELLNARFGGDERVATR